MTINLEKLLMRPIDTFMYNGFRDFCTKLQEHNVKRILEIGSYAGESLQLFKKFLGEDIIVICIDPWQDMPDENDILSKQNFNFVETQFNENSRILHRYAKVKFMSQEIYEMFADGYFDCLYIDGLHTYEQVKLDIQLYQSKVRNGGIISGHDYDIGFTEEQIQFFYDLNGNAIIRKNVTRAIHEFFNKEDISTFSDASWMTFKKIISYENRI